MASTAAASRSRGAHGSVPRPHPPQPASARLRRPVHGRLLGAAATSMRVQPRLLGNPSPRVEGRFVLRRPVRPAGCALCCGLLCMADGDQQVCDPRSRLHRSPSVLRSRRDCWSRLKRRCSPARVPQASSGCSPFRHAAAAKTCSSAFMRRVVERISWASRRSRISWLDSVSISPTTFSKRSATRRSRGGSRQGITALIQPPADGRRSQFGQLRRHDVAARLDLDALACARAAERRASGRRRLQPPQAQGARRPRPRRERRCAP